MLGKLCGFYDHAPDSFFFQTVTNNQFNARQDFLKMLKKKKKKNRDKNKAESSMSNKIKYCL